MPRTDEPSSRWRSRPFGEGTTARHAIAECLARRDGRHNDVPPGCWAEAGAIVNALRGAGFTVKRAVAVTQKSPPHSRREARE